MRLVVSAVRIQFEPSSLSSAASLRDGLQRRAALGVNDATIAASSFGGEREADSILEREQPTGLSARFELGVGVRENPPLVLLALVLPVPDRTALLLGLDGTPELSRAFGMSSLSLECREHCQSVHEELPVAERQEDGKPVSDPALGILRRLLQAGGEARDLE